MRKYRIWLKMFTEQFSNTMINFSGCTDCSMEYYRNRLVIKQDGVMSWLKFITEETDKKDWYCLCGGIILLKTEQEIMEALIRLGGIKALRNYLNELKFEELCKI